eukprot:COSAG04_NODE_1060_length_8514_cov_60.572623_4_plen_129_part_00
MDPGEVWQWETQGYLIVNVMDEDWLAGANLAIDTFRNDPNFVRRIPTSELWQEPDCSSSLLPERPDPDDGGPLLEERMTGLEALPARKCSRSLCAFFRRSSKKAAAQRTATTFDAWSRTRRWWSASTG